MEQEKKHHNPTLAETLLSAGKPMLIRSLEGIVSASIKGLSTVGPVAAFLENSKEFGSAIEVLPSAVEVFTQRYADNFFEREVYRDFFRDATMRVVEAIVRTIREHNGQAPVEKVAKAVDEAIKEVAEIKLLIDESGNIHYSSCRFTRRSPVIQRDRGKDGKSTETRKESRLEEIAFLEAVKAEYPASPCCFKRFEKDREKSQPKPPAKPIKARLSPLDVVGGMPDSIRKEFVTWVAALPEAERKIVLDGLPEMDSEAELLGLMAFPPEHRVLFIPLLRERSERAEKAKTMFRSMGDDLRSMAVGVLNAAREWDASLAPDIEKLRRHADNRQQRRYDEQTRRWLEGAALRGEKGFGPWLWAKVKEFMLAFGV